MLSIWKWPDSSGYAMNCVLTMTTWPTTCGASLSPTVNDLPTSVALKLLVAVGLSGPGSSSLAFSLTTSVRGTFDVLRMTTSAPAGAAITGFANDSPTRSHITCGGETGFSSPSTTTTTWRAMSIERTGANGFS